MNLQLSLHFCNLHIRGLDNNSHDITVQQLHHLGLAVPLEARPGKRPEGPSSSVVRDPPVCSRPLARYVDLEMLVKESLVKT